LQGRAEAAYLSSCDVPFLLPAFIRRLIELLGDYSICAPLVSGFHHPLAAVYRLEILDVVRSLLSADLLRSGLLIEKANTRLVGEAELADVDPTLRSLRNLNTPGDYEAALREIAEL
jgi:molybdopterin-guanine dinucleotide biosynthesis protein A